MLRLHVDTSRILLLAQLGSTLPLVGLIWLVQVLVYPQFAHVAPQDFVAYHAAHARLITWVVAPLMVVELGAALVGVFHVDRGLSQGQALVGAALAVAAWLLTLFVSVPRHDALAHGFDPQALELLIDTNWLRTAVWTLRGGLLLWAVARDG